MTLLGAVVGGVGGVVGAAAVAGLLCGAAHIFSLARPLPSFASPPLPATATASPPPSPGARSAAILEAGTAAAPGSAHTAPAFHATAPATKAPPLLPGGQTRLDRFVFVSWGAPASPEIRPA